LHIVTTVTLSRLIGGPVFIFLYVSPDFTEHAASFPLLILLFVTDVVDGFLARRWDVATHFGYVLDGVADRSTHIAVVVALTTTGVISPVLSFLLVFRDLLLYAARALFAGWWRSNAGFRFRVRVAAVLFKITVGAIALVSYLGAVVPRLMDAAVRQHVLDGLTAATWLFTVWSYWLLAQQIRRYASDARPELEDIE
jgi:CDP-diacylglycerol---glycerol-3-phosphate 3-phosphatidyltransferase